jgi:predicted PurR-regulated permease PerM/catechol 2,3-dioxygenase-like lactoylglutathione lyase family enzyme
LGGRRGAQSRRPHRRHSTPRITPTDDTPIRRAAAGQAPGASLRTLVSWAIAAIVIGFVYLARSVLIPITLAAFLSFLLSPIVATIRRAKVPRAFAVLLAILIALGVASATAVVLVGQAATLRGDAPVYANRIAAKLERTQADLQRRFTFPSLEPKRSSRRPSAAEREGASLRAQQQSAPDADAVPVTVRDAPPSITDRFTSYVVPLLAPIETALIVLVVTIFFMFQKEDIRDRVIRLMGPTDLHRTTLALDDAASRLSRYFLAQSVVNASFGGVIWLGLWLLGIPAPALWGILAGLLRFVPYVGIFIAAFFPLALATASAPGLGLLFAVAGLFVVVEILVGYVVEPLIYGRSTGLAPVSVVVAAIFWAWIWGPIGLVLAMPLTLMLVVLGRHIPAFELFDILLGDRPPLTAAETFYQRTLALRPEDAIENAEDQLGHLSLRAFYDEVALPGLCLAAADVERGVVERSAMGSVCETVGQIVEALRELPTDGVADPDVPPRMLEGRTILCVAGRGPLDTAVGAMAVHLFEQAGADVRSIPRDAPDLSWPAEERIDAICILGLFHTRSARRIATIAARYRQAFPGAAICIGVRWRDEPGTSESDPPLAASLGALIDCLMPGTTASQ